MNQNNKFQIERETVNHHWALRLQMGCKAICNDKRKASLVLAYALVALLLWLVQPWLLICRSRGPVRPCGALWNAYWVEVRTERSAACGACEPRGGGPLFGGKLAG